MQGLRGLLSFSIAEAVIRHGLGSVRLFSVPAACVGGAGGDRSLRCLQAMTRRGGGVGKARAAGRPTAPTPRRFYAVHRGRDGFRGILPDWPACKRVVDRVPGAVFKAFASRADAVAFAEHGYLAGASRVVADPPDIVVPPASSVVALQHATAELRRRTNSVAGPSVQQPSGSVKEQLVVYTDGACVGNGRTGARAGVGVYFADEHGEHSVHNVSQPLEGHVQTNQRAELTAVLLALRISLEKGLVKAGASLLIKTDSKYTSTGLTEWVHRWKKNGFLTATGQPVKNADLWRDLDFARCEMERSGITVIVEWVRGHNGNYGNEQADRLAVAGVNSL